MSEIQKIYKRGKLMISGAYAVLDGATAFAVPTNLGQSFEFENLPGKQIDVVATDRFGKIWFEARFDSGTLNVIDSDRPEAETLSKLFRAARELNPKFASNGFYMRSALEFNREWGLGSSSTLIAALASFAGVDAYRLLDLGFGGSGYDIAVANRSKPILYSRESSSPRCQEISWNFERQSELFLVYLGQKMNSREGIAQYGARSSDSGFLNRMSEISQEISKAKDLEHIEALKEEEEQLLSKRLSIPSLKQSRFADLPVGVIASLGAWGGDFALFTRKENIPYLKGKGYSVIFKASDLCMF